MILGDHRAIAVSGHVRILLSHAKIFDNSVQATAGYVADYYAHVRCRIAGSVFNRDDSWRSRQGI